jgi:hypothetical protein
VDLLATSLSEELLALQFPNVSLSELSLSVHTPIFVPSINSPQKTPSSLNPDHPLKNPMVWIEKRMRF